MRSRIRPLVMIAVAVALGGCAFIPKTNLRLEEARHAHVEASADRDLASLAPVELRRAEEALDRALAAWSTLDDPAVVDHLAYLAKQRFAIAREAAKRYAAERQLRAHTPVTAASAR